MPIIRYVLVAGAIVVALLFALDRSLPRLGDSPASPQVDRTVIRIHSAQALPERITLDTSARLAAAVALPLAAADMPRDPPIVAQYGATRPAAPLVETKKPRPVEAHTTRTSARRSAAMHSSRRARTVLVRGPDRLMMFGAF